MSLTANMHYTTIPFCCEKSCDKFPCGYDCKCGLDALNMEYNKQLLDEVEHDIMNYQNRGLCYLPKPKPEADNADTRF